MRIAKLKVQNFRGIKQGQLLIPSHAVLVGDNNIGKSSLLEAVDWCSGQSALPADLSSTSTTFMRDGISTVTASLFRFT